MSDGEVMARSRADLLVQSVTDYAIYMLDPTGVIVSWNAGAERFKGYRAEEIIGQHFSRFYSAEDRAAGIPERALRTALSEGRLEAEGWRIRKDGTRFWANVVIDPIRDEHGEHVGFAKVTRDLSERRKAEEELRRSEERFRLLVQSVTDYAIYMLDPGGRVTSWNAGAERFKGYASNEIIGRHFSQFYLDEDRAAGVPQRALATALREGRFEAEGWRVRKDGTRFWASVVIDPIRDDRGEHVGFAKVTRDLTERKQAQEALDQAREQFFQAQKLEAIGKLSGGIAHDFNNLLAAILSSLDLARRRLREGKDVSGFLENASRAAERGSQLTQRMLAFARKQELKLEAVDLAVSLRNMSELLVRTLGPNIAISIDLPATLPKVWADSAQIELALLNLVVNARDAMPEGGNILISAKLVDDPAGSGRGFVRLSIADDGEGMDKDTLARAAEPFFTTKGIGKGTGLGLSMVEGMIEQCGGKLELHSVVGEGTTVSLSLPLARAGAESARPPAQAEVPDTTRPLSVLAVDDDPIVLVNTTAMLTDLGHRVYHAANGSLALTMLANLPVDLLITDYAMPGMTGVELIERARAIRPDLRMIVVSGFADLDHGVVIDAMRLAKPFREHQLAATIAECMRCAVAAEGGSAAPER